MKKRILKICGHTIQPGEHLSIRLPTPKLFTYTPVDIPIHIFNSKKPGPILFVCAGIHGDEISGVEIVRHLLKLNVIKNLSKGTLIAAPIVNIYGFIYQSRYLPDRRDLNRNFPGLRKGSLASRLAKLFIDEIVSHCTHGIDLHSAAVHRRNLPQIRVNLTQPGTEKLARAFGAPVILDSNLRDGSLRQAANEMNIPVLIYEAGEALRFDEAPIRLGVRGILRVMRELGMLYESPKSKKILQPLVAHSSVWVRAPRSGIIHSIKPLGKKVEKGDLLGIIADPFGSEEFDILSPRTGIIIGYTTIPLINEGEALFHIACFKKAKKGESPINYLQQWSTEEIIYD
ncbi:succinylglutamate desuccinylase/aspartoacylase family protein [Coxiella burnetii]|uniref:succinylglutamate desuccinylase/aspartoacylase family protein n=1 Tax=Coxiella burnetii TaxID=777 RepID=UPI000183CDE3|nr:succinylglutamate desuccinylase/aspartoacylase family protein [Coxiella burnetii]ACJ17839.1 succinylglutamate desuccinylase/Aspartoacylase family protein [Coxiella burnetii CbuG_Q212]ATN66271.1 succinylglutamate desuccinylase [Coxiella burnetii]OYK86791.1 succinylglutamate desuccinylase [Coxiella burnetii]